MSGALLDGLVARIAGPDEPEEVSLDLPIVVIENCDFHLSVLSSYKLDEKSIQKYPAETIRLIHSFMYMEEMPALNAQLIVDAYRISCELKISLFFWLLLPIQEYLRTCSGPDRIHILSNTVSVADVDTDVGDIVMSSVTGPAAATIRGICHYRGIGVPRNVPLAGCIFRSNWFQGKSFIDYYNLALCGDLVDDSVMFGILAFISDSFLYPPALHSLGVCVYNGVGIARDVSKARAIFSYNWRAHRYSHSLHYLALCSFDRSGVISKINGVGDIDVDASAAAYRFHRLDWSLYRDKMSRHNVGLILFAEGRVDHALRVLHSNDCSESAHFLADYYFDTDRRKSHSLYFSNFRRSYLPSLHSLALCLLCGYGVVRNVAYGCDLLRTISGRNPDSLFVLGYCKFYGIGKRDRAEAFRIFDGILSLRFSDDRYVRRVVHRVLGLCYRDGYGVAVDLPRAVEFMERAYIDYGDVDVLYDLLDAYVDVGEKAVVDILKILWASSGDVRCIRILIRCCEKSLCSGDVSRLAVAASVYPRLPVRGIF